MVVKRKGWLVGGLALLVFRLIQDDAILEHEDLIGAADRARPLLVLGNSRRYYQVGY
jgi:hypothetical protein